MTSANQNLGCRLALGQLECQNAPRRRSGTGVRTGGSDRFPRQTAGGAPELDPQRPGWPVEPEPPGREEVPEPDLPGRRSLCPGLVRRVAEALCPALIAPARIEDCGHLWSGQGVSGQLTPSRMGE